MKYLKNKTNRMLVSLLAGMIAAVCLTSACGYEENTAPLAWWGTLYPEFCFGKMEGPELSEASDDSRPSGQVKISFWLAQVLNW